VAPDDATKMLATWMQDGPSALATPIATSHDSGQSFATALPHGMSACTGGDFSFVLDPAVALGPHGAAYLAAAADHGAGGDTTTAVEVTRSGNSGDSWSAPVALDRAPLALSFIDSPRITVDPGADGVAYLTYVQQLVVTGLPALAGLPYSPTIAMTRFSKTTDGGRTWGQPRTIYMNTPPDNWPEFNQLFILPRHILVDVFQGISEGGGPIEILSMRSTDGGRNWTRPVHVASYPNAPITAPQTGAVMDVFRDDKAAAPDGTVYAMWEQREAGGRYLLRLSQSTNAGASWSGPRTAVSAASPVLQPSLAVDAAGTLGLTWYDLTNDRSGDSQTTADAWFAHSSDRGASWIQQHLAGPFDLRSAADSPQHYYLGDYQGLTALDSGFAATFTQAKPAASAGPTDVFFATLKP
jgi:hypothetical protein